MKSRASRAVPIYIFSASSFFRAKWHKFCFLCAPLKSRHREKCFDFGANRHRKKSLVRTVQAFPFAILQRVFFARVPFIVLYILSLPSPFCQFCSPLIFRPSNPHPVQPSQPSPPSLHPPHPCVSFSKEKSERFVRKEPFKTVTCALQTARQTLRNSP